jgi:ATP-binding cassette subfamily F protein 3
MNIYRGTYEEYLEQKKQEEERLISAYKRQQKEIEDLEIFISRFRAKASLAASVQSKIKYLEKMEKIVLPVDQKKVGFSFPQPERSGQNVLVLEGVKQSYDGKTFIYNGLDLTLERGQKIALVGPNGAGKSTLLKLLAGVLPFQAGERKLGFNVEAGYFSQHRSDMFQPGRTAFQEAADTRRAHSETGIRTLLGSFLFSGEMVHKKVEVLSGGEKSRLGLVKILLDPPNLLLMDEPTTHLDMTSVDVLVEALEKFEGTFCFISHDVYFVRRLATHIIHVNQGKITWYPGNYDYFLHRKAQEEGEEAALFRSEELIEAETHHKPLAVDAKPKEGKSGRKTKEQKRKEAEERNERYRLAKLKEQGGAPPSPDEEEAAIMAALGDPETHKDPEKIKELTRRLGELKKAKDN